MNLYRLSLLSAFIVGGFAFIFGWLIRHDAEAYRQAKSLAAPPKTFAIGGDHSGLSHLVEREDRTPEAWMAESRPSAADWDTAYTRLRFSGWLGRSKFDRAKRLRVERVLDANARYIKLLGNEWSGGAADRTRAEFINKITAALDSLLTPDEMHSLRQEIKMEEISRTLNEIGAALYVKNDPLNEKQLGDLAGLFVACCPGDSGSDVPISLKEIDWNRALGAAKSVLMTQQMEVLTAFAAREQFNREFRRITGYSAARNVPGI